MSAPVPSKTPFAMAVAPSPLIRFGKARANIPAPTMDRPVTAFDASGALLRDGIRFLGFFGWFGDDILCSFRWDCGYEHAHLLSVEHLVLERLSTEIAPRAFFLDLNQLILPQDISSDFEGNMVRNYRPKNRLYRNSKVSYDDTVGLILGLFDLRTPSELSANIGLSSTAVTRFLDEFFRKIHFLRFLTWAKSEFHRTDELSELSKELGYPHLLSLAFIYNLRHGEASVPHQMKSEYDVPTVDLGATRIIETLEKIYSSKNISIRKFDSKTIPLFLGDLSRLDFAKKFLRGLERRAVAEISNLSNGLTSRRYADYFALTELMTEIADYNRDDLKIFEEIWEEHSFFNGQRFESLDFRIRAAYIVIWTLAGTPLNDHNSEVDFFGVFFSDADAILGL